MITLAVTDAPTEVERGAVGGGLRAHNTAFVGADGFATMPLAVLARDAAGEVVGGLVGITMQGWLYVDRLHVAPAMRGEGIGGRVLAAAEDAARARGCVGVRLDTYSFQAPGFYAHCGYTLLATLDDHPPGHSRHLLCKRLDGDSRCST